MYLESNIFIKSLENGNKIFLDKHNKEHILTKEVQELWLRIFNLKSLESTYIPNQNIDIQKALNGKELRLQVGSLCKIVAQGREQFIPQIKEVLDNPQIILQDTDKNFLFIKHLKDNNYFVNVSFDNGEYLVSISNGIKETRNIRNKLKRGAKLIYQSPNFNFISQKLLQTSQYSANETDKKNPTTSNIKSQIKDSTSSLNIESKSNK